MKTLSWSPSLLCWFGATIALRQSAVLLERSQLIDAQRFSPLEQLSSIVPEHLKNQPFVADVDDSLGVILDSWQSVDGALHLIGRHLSPSCCERCIVRLGDSVLFSTMNVRRSSDLSIECLFRNQYTIESFPGDSAMRVRRAIVTVEMRGLDGSTLSLPSLAVVNASDVVADAYVHESPALAPLCACTVVMNRNTFLAEWIAHHRALGVEQFFFYRNGGERLDEALLSLLDDGALLDSYFWAHSRAQRQAFAHCMARLRERCEWALFVDVDEFVVPASPRASLTAIVAAARSDVIELPASVFAAATNDSHTLVIESATRYFTPATQVNAKKSLVRTRAAKLANNIHTFELDRAHRKPGSVCAPACASALASLSHFRFIGWPLYMRRTLDGVAGDVGLWRVPRVLSVLKPSVSFTREATLASGRFEAVDERLLVRAPALRAELQRLRVVRASPRTRAIRELLARHPRAAVPASEIERATLSRDELAAVRADADALLPIAAQGARHLARTAPDGTALAVLLVPPRR